MTFDDVNRMTIPQLLCRSSKTPPSSGGAKHTSFESYMAAVEEYEASWRSGP